jgi:integrase
LSVHKLKRKERVVYKAVWRDERGSQRSKTFTLKADAVAWDAKTKLAKRQGELAALDAGKQLLRDFLVEWRALYAEPHLAPTTLRLYDDLVTRILVPTLGHMNLRQLTTQRIQQASADLMREGVPAATVRKSLTLLQGALERAVEWGKINANPARYVRKPNAPAPRLTDPLSPRQVEEVRRVLLDRGRLRDATLVSVLAYAGLRPGEALALRWEDLKRRTISVDKSLALGEERSTKTRRTRSVRMLTPLASDLAKWKLASDQVGSGDLIFPASRGSAWTDADYRNWRKRHFKTAAATAGLGQVRPYALRHSFASLLLAEQTNPAEIASQLGHSLQMLFSTYAHVIEDLRGEGRIDADEAIRRARGTGARRNRPKMSGVRAADQHAL